MRSGSLFLSCCFFFFFFNDTATTEIYTLSLHDALPILHGLQRNASLFRSAGSSFEINPAFIETVQHLQARGRILHPLRREQFLPRLAGHHFHAHWSLQEPGKGGRNLVWRHALRSFEFHHSATGPVFLKQSGGHPANVRSCHHRHRLVERLQETWNHALRARRSHVPTAVLHEPCGPQKSNRRGQSAESLFDDCMLGQKVGPGGLRPNRREVNDSRRRRRFQCGSQSYTDRPGLGKPGCRVETRWHEHEDAFRPPERGRERGRILDCGERDFTATICPRSTFISVPHDSPDLLICGEKGMSHDPSDLAGNSHDCIHSYSFRCLMHYDRTTGESAA